MPSTLINCTGERRSSSVLPCRGGNPGSLVTFHWHSKSVRKALLPSPSSLWRSLIPSWHGVEVLVSDSQAWTSGLPIQVLLMGVEIGYSLLQCAWWELGGFLLKRVILQDCPFMNPSAREWALSVPFVISAIWVFWFTVFFSSKVKTNKQTWKVHHRVISWVPRLLAILPFSFYCSGSYICYIYKTLHI